MDDISPEKKSLESLEIIENNSIKNNDSKYHELDEENKNENENESENKSDNNNNNNENSVIKNEKIESNISEINNKNEENDSLLQKEINEININEHSDKEQKLEEVNNNSKIKKTKSSKVKKSSKANKLKVSQKEIQKSNFDDLIYGNNRYHNKNILDYIKQKEEKEITECSFKPRINKKIGFEVNKLFNNKEENVPNLSQNKNVVERLLLWNQRVKQKLIEKKNERDKQNIEKDICTFTPILKSEVPKFEKKKINGSDKYYDRIKNSREIKKEKEKKLNPDYDELYKKYYKNKENTYLQKNKKVTKKAYKNYLNQFHNIIMNDDL